jgi:hypothetical protein
LDNGQGIIGAVERLQRGHGADIRDDGIDAHRNFSFMANPFWASVNFAEKK